MSQLETEYKHSPVRIKSLIDKSILSYPGILFQINDAITNCLEFFKSQDIQINPNTDIQNEILRILRIVCTEPKGITMSALVGRLRTSDDPQQIEITGEIVIQCALVDLFNLAQNKLGYLDIHPVFTCDRELLAEVHSKEHMPPMIEPPCVLTRNTSSAYLSVDVDSLILGKGNHHSGDISLDSLNIFNAIPLELDRDSITKDNSEHRYLLENGNKFYLPHKYDKRGRTYCIGYHTSYQSHEYNKSVLNFNEKEIIEGF